MRADVNFTQARQKSVTLEVLVIVRDSNLRLEQSSPPFLKVKR